MSTDTADAFGRQVQLGLDRRRLLLASAAIASGLRPASAADTPTSRIEIAEQSVMSLMIEPRIKGKAIASGTGFIVGSRRGPLLLTNRHVLTAHAPEPDGRSLLPSGEFPDEITIIHNYKDQLGRWIPKVERLYDNGRARWIEHPTLKGKADVAALPLTDLVDVDVHPYNLGNPSDIIIGPADVVSVIGFPFGLSARGFGVWATGFVASEIDVDFGNLPVFLIDCRSRPGQSGSPVIAYRNGGTIHTHTALMAAIPGPAYRFLGIYSGRISAESDLGLVWKSSVITDVIISAEG